MKIVNKSLLSPVHDEDEGRNRYVIKDKKYMIAANPITMRRFGPSESLKNKNIILEHVIAVIPKTSNVVFSDLKYIFIVYIKQMLLFKPYSWSLSFPIVLRVHLK